MHALKALFNWVALGYNIDYFAIPNDSIKSMFFCFFHVEEHVSLLVEFINIYTWINGVNTNFITTFGILHNNTT